jgi:hypothetical protein
LATPRILGNDLERFIAEQSAKLADGLSKDDWSKVGAILNGGAGVVAGYYKALVANGLPEPLADKLIEDLSFNLHSVLVTGRLDPREACS